MGVTFAPSAGGVIPDWRDLLAYRRWRRTAAQMEGSEVFRCVELAELLRGLHRLDLGKERERSLAMATEVNLVRMEVPRDVSGT
jgi:hypothetical protein